MLRMEVHEQILNSAIKLFADKGFDGVSIRQIAEDANVHFASLRYHFGSKEDLYKECLASHGEKRLNSAKKFLQADPESFEDMKLRLTFAINEIFLIHNENPHLSKLLLHEVETSIGSSDYVLKRTMVAMSELYAEFFQKCQNRGFISKELDPSFLTMSLMGIIHHFMRTENIRKRILSHKSLKNRETRDQIVKNIVKLCLHPKEIL